MECPLHPDPQRDRIARAAARLNAAVAQISQAQERLMEARERLAVARRALENAPAPGAQDPHSADDPM